MAERDQRRYLPLALPNSVDVTALNWLVDRGRLPKDIELRASLEGERRGDDHRSDHYREAFNEAVVAALDGKPLPAFVNAPYPNAFSLVMAGDWHGRAPLDMLREDFHTFRSLILEARKLGVNENVMFTLWHRIITEIEPKLGSKIGEEGRKTNRWYHQLSHVVIKDQPAFEAYHSERAQHRLRVGIGARAVQPLGFLLADNHPEMYGTLNRSAED